MRDGKNHTIYELLRARAEHAPETAAIVAPGRGVLNYRELLSQVDGVVRSLIVKGIHPIDRVAIVLPNGPEMAVTFLGVAARAICAPLNPANSSSEFEFCLADLDPKAVIVQSGMNSAAIAVATKRRIPIIELFPTFDAAAGIFTLSANEQPVTSACDLHRADSIALILHTSGTTARPKRVPLTQANLLASAGNIAATLRLSEVDRCLNLMPLFHIHGLVGALLSSLMAGAGVVCTSGFDHEQFFRWLEAFQPTWYTAVPTIHHAVIARAQADPTARRNHSLRFIRSASSALPARVMRGLEEVFKVPVIESYGMTEAAHQIASNPLPPSPRKAGSVGLAAGPQVAIMDEAGNWLSTGEIGEIAIRGANVMSGYDNNSGANATAFTRGWFRTGDQGYLDEDGYLFITGRLKEIINRGGEKISPREVDEVILRHAAVAEAVSFAIPHATLGEDIAAAVVLRQNAAVAEEELRRFVAAQLAEFKIPRRVLFVDEIPKSATGKPQRIGLAERLGPFLSRAMSNDFEAPQTQVQKTLAAIWSEVLDVEQVGIQDNFFNLGGDSIRATQVISRVREAMQAVLTIPSFFETPTLGGLADLIERSRRTEALQQIRPVLSVPRNDKLPLSFAQQRLWFLNQFEPANPVYNRPLALRLTGALQTQVIERCLNEIVQRHEILRTNFHDSVGGPVQIIAPHFTIELPVTDLSYLPESERETAALHQAVRESQQAFDLARGVLLRSRLYRLAEQDHLLLVVTHHIVFDGWSDSVLLGELAAFYSAISSGHAAALCDLRFQYADYAAWQRQQSEENTLDTDLSYWQRQLGGSTSSLSLPTDRPRPAVRSHRGAKRSFALPLQLSKRLKEISGRERVTLFMTLLAAFKTLLYRYTGQEDILVGVPTAGRSLFETERLLGVFINTLVLRTDLSGAPSFRELLRRLREVALGAYTHQGLPFEKLIQGLQPDRDLSRNPLFDVMFQLRNLPQRDIALPGLQAACVDLDIGVADFDLTLEIIDEDDGLECRFVYSTDLFDAATIVRMAGHFHSLLEGIAANPERRISELPLLTEAERQQILVEWNDTKRDYPSDKWIHRLFEEQVGRTPEAPAVVFEHRRLTYRELNNRANQLARHLRKFSVGPNVLVGICLERSLEMVVAVLGVLKAGAAYVPLDLCYPSERLAFILNDTKATVLLTKERRQKENSAGIDENSEQICRRDSAVKVVCLDSDWIHIESESQENIATGTTADDLAYVIYTSGSTGRPKGVMVNHRALVAHTLSAIDHYELGSHDKVLQFASLSFDVAAEEIFPALLSGASVALLPERSPTIRDFVDYLINDGITVVNLPSSYWHQWVDELDRLANKLPASLRLLIVGNEKVSLDHFKRWHQAFDNKVRWLNAYGPTEATITATLYDTPRGDENYRDLRSVPIGRPMTNRQIYLLDRYRQPVPIGATGEIYIGGPALAVGYLNDSELTAQKFICNPFSGASDGRIYSTGDRARYLPDGNIELIGRMDDQVKIHGYRIEIGEIAAVLRQDPAVQECAVVAWDGNVGDSAVPRATDPWLVAYVVVKSGCEFTNAETRKALKLKLPEYMVPHRFVVLDSLPRTSAGKLDRKALPSPDPGRADLTASYVAPRNSLERTVAGIWAEVLKLERVGIYDNFFDLGGHSLLATQIIPRVNDALQLNVHLRSLFEAPTVVQFAKQIQASAREFIDPTLLSIKPLSSEPECPLSFSQQRFWFLSQLEPAQCAYNESSVFRLDGALDVKALEAAFGEIVRRHEALRTTFTVRHGVAVQIVGEPGQVRLRIIDLTDIPRADIDAEIRRLFKQEFHTPFDLSSDPMLRVTLLRVNDTEHMLFVIIHHIATDQWSKQVLFKELSAIYQAFALGTDHSLAALPIQYRHYASWQRSVLKDAVLDKQLSYWKQQLGDRDLVLSLPTDYPRPALRSLRGERITLVLPMELVEGLRELGRKNNATFFMVLLAVFKLLLHRLTGQDDICVGAPIAGRDRLETEGLIGLFLNTLVLRTDLSGNPAFVDLLARVRDVTIGAYEHGELPFEKLVEELKPRRDPGRTPLFQVFFNMYDLAEAELDLGALSVEALDVREPISLYDLTVYMRKHGDATHLTLNYSTDLFGRASMSEFFGQYRFLLEQIAKAPDQPIAAYSLVTPEAAVWLPNPSETLDATPRPLVTTMFTRQAEQRPTAAAISQNERIWTYGELAERAQLLARILLARGLEPGGVVGVQGPPCFGLVVAAVGTLLSGGVLLFIDPNLPASRKRLMLRQARARTAIFLGGEESANEWLHGDEVRDILLVDLAAASVSELATELDLQTGSLPAILPDDAAYIFFTSGTTGIPKGVLGSHKGLSHFIDWQRRTFTVGPQDRVAQLSGLSFDVVLQDLFLPLCSGAILCLPGAGDVRGAAQTLEWLERQQVTLLHTVPTLAQHWLSHDVSEATLSALRLVFFAGEPLTDTLVRRWRAAFPSCGELVNLYGPTETTLAKCFYRIPSQIPMGIQPVGQPLPETQALILRGKKQLCGVNEIGEIVLRTPFRSLGYINTPDEQRQRFVRNPCTDDDQDLLYFTGDRGRYLSNGCLEILTRLDDQVKIRGVRVEPAEVAATLSRHPALASCYVATRQDGQHGTQLVAYVVAKDRSEATVRKLTTYLAGELPGAMIPAAMVFIDHLPLTANGKVDRAALPTAAQTQLDLDESYVAPRTPTERLLAGIWVEVLGLERAGIHDNFFELGGHSLLAIQIVFRISRAFAVDLPLRVMFEAPTVSQLATLITAQQAQHWSDSNLVEMVSQLDAMSDDEAEQALKRMIDQDRE